MNTVIKEQKFFKDVVGVIFCIDIMEMNADSWCEEIQAGWEEISADEAMLLANPPPTTEQLIAQADVQKQSLINAAMQSIDVLQLKLRAGRTLTNAENVKLNAILDYIDAVNAIDTSTAPDITWPVKPAA